ncbi:hypothetical protein HDU76_006373 [Blyttiomyces sp. JEL0837]|nr:hypothetical protein HDU76_006373 [Blyttiomyces sp. JEL0837]
MPLSKHSKKQPTKSTLSKLKYLARVFWLAVIFAFTGVIFATGSVASVQLISSYCNPSISQTNNSTVCLAISPAASAIESVIHSCTSNTFFEDIVISIEVKAVRLKYYSSQLFEATKDFVKVCLGITPSSADLPPDVRAELKRRFLEQAEKNRIAWEIEEHEREVERQSRAVQLKEVADIVANIESTEVLPASTSTELVVNPTATPSRVQVVATSTTKVTKQHVQSHIVSSSAYTSMAGAEKSKTEPDQTTTSTTRTVRTRTVTIKRRRVTPTSSVSPVTPQAASTTKLQPSWSTEPTISTANLQKASYTPTAPAEEPVTSVNVPAPQVISPCQYGTPKPHDTSSPKTVSPNTFITTTQSLQSSTSPTISVSDVQHITSLHQPVCKRQQVKQESGKGLIIYHTKSQDLRTRKTVFQEPATTYTTMLFKPSTLTPTVSTSTQVIETYQTMRDVLPFGPRLESGTAMAIYQPRASNAVATPTIELSETTNILTSTGLHDHRQPSHMITSLFEERIQAALAARLEEEEKLLEVVRLQRISYEDALLQDLVKRSKSVDDLVVTVRESAGVTVDHEVQTQHSSIVSAIKTGQTIAMTSTQVVNLDRNGTNISVNSTNDNVTTNLRITQTYDMVTTAETESSTGRADTIQELPSNLATAREVDLSPATQMQAHTEVQATAEITLSDDSLISTTEANTILRQPTTDSVDIKDTQLSSAVTNLRTQKPSLFSKSEPPLYIYYLQYETCNSSRVISNLSTVAPVDIPASITYIGPWTDHDIAGDVNKNDSKGLKALSLNPFHTFKTAPVPHYKLLRQTFDEALANPPSASFNIFADHNNMTTVGSLHNHSFSKQKGRCELEYGRYTESDSREVIPISEIDPTTPIAINKECFETANATEAAPVIFDNDIMSIFDQDDHRDINSNETGMHGDTNGNGDQSDHGGEYVR